MLIGSAVVGVLAALWPAVRAARIRPLEAIVASLFIFGAFALLRGRHEEAREGRETEPSFWRVAGASFAVVAVAEFGDLTQIVTANLEAHYQSPFAVGAGALAALVSVAALAIFGGRALLRVIPVRWLTRAAAAAMMVLAGFSLAGAIRG